MGNNVAAVDFSEVPPKIKEWRRFVRVFFSRGIVVFGLVILLLMLITAIFAPLLAPYPPNKIHPADSLAGPSKTHLLGADKIGRDTLSRLIYGTRTALIVGFVTVFLSALIGITLGLIAGHFGGILNMLIMRSMDALMCFPMIMLALLISAVLGGGMKNVIIALTFASVPVYARVVHGLTLSIRENDYILAERAMGSSSLRIMFGHILPNAFAPLIVIITLQLGNLILSEAGLSFLGIGITAPQAAWGSMVSDGRQYLLNHPILSIAPGIAIMLVVFAFNLVGDGLRDALDPRLRGFL
jgi:ABC-type dipeptide/oligopeptide/nickel transport system permease subunit